ncbi:glycosyl transferase, family 9 [Psychromonas ingrahamii 37]|uniref:Glycosyl transferase, family 9 n=1 Tax=Psychromonas ingrahamii (strain DSM 17664 / CCUG 51855 / 37) TaxID=357804 RepID=A1SRS8_PSYIN|nr:glycosyltransferase family 9 protein [Psychromonas ingrahamii]ABM02193.1 glycosyl transferase, family 9 [Psychromonas ingrahamii 37]
MRKILVVRNDKIGDFMLAWPSFAMLKKSLPDAQIDALVPAYTKPLAQLCPWIDNVIVDDPEQSQQARLVNEIKAENYSDYICLFSTTRNAQLGRKAKIAYRLAPATKWAQFLFNDRLKQRRSQSAKPESEYNLDLIRHFLQKNKITPVEVRPPFLNVDRKVKQTQRNLLQQKLGKSINKLCFIHAGSGGSANNLSIAQYAHLITLLNEHVANLGFILTAGPGEEVQAKQLQALLPDNVCSYLYQSTKGLISFCQTISCADLFIAGSTGPLHIAGAADVPTAGFFPAKRSATPLRWQPLNSTGRHIAFIPPNNNSQDDMTAIDINLVMQNLLSFLEKNNF